MRRIRSGWSRLTCQTLAVAMIFLGLTVLAPPQAHAVADAVVSGTVVDSVTQQPLASVTVADSTSGRSVMTAVAGTYSLSVPAGDHVLTATLAGYVPSSTPELALTAGQTLTSQGFTLVQYASASGVVTEKGTSTGIATIVVKFFDASTTDLNPLFVATTGPDGSWAIAHVAPGTYEVEFDGTGTDYVDHWYLGSASRPDAATVTVAAGESKVLSDALLHKPRVKGKALVYASVSYAPFVGATVTATSETGSARSAEVDANGDYDLRGLPEGRYQVQVSAPGYGIVWLGSGSADTFPYDLRAGDVVDLGYSYSFAGATVTGTVHLPAGVTALVLCNGMRTTTAANGTYTFTDVSTSTEATVAVYALGFDPQRASSWVGWGQTLRLDFTLVASAQPPAAARGRVSDSSGASISGAKVSDPASLATATTDASGSFSLPRVDPTNLQFRVSAPSYLARTVTVTDPATVGTVVLERPASLTGRVTVGPRGDPAAGASIQLVRSDAWAETVRTNIDGRYTLDDLAPGYYQIAATVVLGSDPMTIYLGGAVSPSLAVYTQVAEGVALTGRDIAMPVPATLSGVVKREGTPAGGGYSVTLTGMGTTAGTQTSMDGTFVISGVKPGTYRLSVGDGVDTSWWNTMPSVNAAAEISVLPGDALTGYVISLPAWYTLSGTLRSPSGAALPNTSYAITDGSQTLTGGSDPSGHYSLTLRAGTYEMGAALGYGHVDWSPGSTSADIINLTGDVVRDFTLPDTATLTLKVKGSDGSSPYSYVATVYNLRGQVVNQASYSGSNQTVVIPLDMGTFRVEVISDPYLPWSTQLTITASSQVAVTLDVGGTIKGTTTIGALVTAINAATGEHFSMGAGSSYAMSGLPAGDYVVTAAEEGANGPCGPASWYGGSSYLTAQRLHLGSGVVVTGIDFTLSCPSNWSSGGTLYGDVTLPPTAPSGALADVTVQVTSAVGLFVTAPDSAGSFALTMPPGTYEISAYQSALGYEAHMTVMIVTGSVMIITLNMSRRGLVQGQVVGPLGEPVVASLSNAETSTKTDDQGKFSLGGIAYGSHTLTVVPTNPLYALTFFDVTVGANSDALGVTIHTALAGTMSGKLATSLGTVEVVVLDASGRVVASDYFSQSLSFTGLPPGPLKVRFSGPQVVTEWWRDAADQASATPIQMPSGGGVTDVTPNLRPATGGESLTTISGKVTFAGGPLGGVTLSTTVGTQTVTATTAADGTYSVAVPRGDTYPLRAEVCFGPNIKPCAGEHFVDSQDVVADAATKSGVDFVIQQPPSSFTISPQPVVTGRPASGQTLTATVPAWSPTPDTTTWQWFADGLSIFNATGSTFALTDAQMGRRIQVVVTRSKAGYATLTLASVATEPVEVPGAIKALTPSRLLDSRIGQGFSGPATNGTVIKLVMWGQGGVPQGASAVLVNITVTQPTASGYVTAYASGGAAPWVSNANFTPGVTVANLSLVPVGLDGAIALKVATPGSVHVIADVQGYVVGGTVLAAGAVVPVTPARVLDTRTTQHVGTGGTISLVVAGVVGVPADASAVVANITVTGTTGPGFLTAWPAGVARPTSSNVNFVTGQTVPNMAIVKVGSNKSISLFNSSGPMDVVVDIQGYVTAGTATLPGTVMPVTPKRVVDTRISLGAPGPAPENNGWIVDFDNLDLVHIPQGVLINLTVTEPQAAGWLSAFPYGVSLPLVSNLNFTPGAVVPNLALLTLGQGYGVLYNGSGGTSQIVADVLAYVLA